MGDIVDSLGTTYTVNREGDCKVRYNTNAPHATRGARVLLNTLPRASLENVGSGSLFGRRYVDDNGAPLGPIFEFWDATYDEICIPIIDGADGFSCISKDYGVVSENHFQSSQCLESDYLSYPQCPDLSPRLSALTSSGRCSGTSFRSLDEVYETGAIIGDSYYFENDYVTCEQRSMSIGNVRKLGISVRNTLPQFQVGIDDQPAAE